jgi:hypothetical protein
MKKLMLTLILVLAIPGCSSDGEEVQTPADSGIDACRKAITQDESFTDEQLTDLKAAFARSEQSPLNGAGQVWADALLGHEGQFSVDIKATILLDECEKVGVVP